MDSLDVRWFRPRPQRLVLRTVQMRVMLVDPDLGERPSGTETLAPDRTTLVPEVSAAPPLAVRPVEDADWTFRD